MLQHHLEILAPELPPYFPQHDAGPGGRATSIQAEHAFHGNTAGAGGSSSLSYRIG
jgi:hypothetical protein